MPQQPPLKMPTHLELTRAIRALIPKEHLSSSSVQQTIWDSATNLINVTSPQPQKPEDGK